MKTKKQQLFRKVEKFYQNRIDRLDEKIAEASSYKRVFLLIEMQREFRDRIRKAQWKFLR